jgi:hypothetical protein
LWIEQIFVHVEECIFQVLLDIWQDKNLYKTARYTANYFSLNYTYCSLYCCKVGGWVWSCYKQINEYSETPFNVSLGYSGVEHEILGNRIWKKLNTEIIDWESVKLNVK